MMVGLLVRIVLLKEPQTRLVLLPVPIPQALVQVKINHLEIYLLQVLRVRLVPYEDLTGSLQQ
jgi:hypothetical protein